MASKPKIAVVIPCYRVEGHIRKVIENLPNYIWRIVVVDDASPDQTGRTVAAMHDPRVVLVRHETNQGVGGAMTTGYRTCLDLGADIIVKMDGDDQMDPAHLPALLDPLLRQVADYTKGNRWADGVNLRQMPMVRRWGNLGLSFITKFASGYWNVFDPCNGYTAITATALRRLQLDQLARNYFFEISMLSQLAVHRAVVKDVLMPARYGDEKSSLRISRVLLQFPVRLLKIACQRIWTRYFVVDFTAVSACLFFGLLLSVFGASFGAYTWVHSAAQGIYASAGQVMIATMPLLVGIQLLLQALNLDIAGQPQRPLTQEEPSPINLRLLYVGEEESLTYVGEEESLAA